MDKLLKSDVNFQRVRDGRNALPFYFDLDLSTARSVAAGTHFIANVAGDSFYADANPVDGNCVVHFQDTNLDRAAVPFYVSPGFIANVPFTQLLIENAAQPGKKIRISYGVNIDFQPGSVAQIAVSNSGGYTALRPEGSTGFLSSTSATVALTAETYFTPAQNPNGAILLGAGFSAIAAAGDGAAFIAHTAAPATFATGEMVLSSQRIISGASQCDIGQLSIPQFIAAGKGLYFLTGAALGASNANMRFARWKAL